MFNYSAWFSVALEYGLSILSMGKVGSSDDQLLTGGLTAVESLLGTEIGIAKKEEFVIDHGNSHMERIPLMYDDQNLYAQFLIQSQETEKIDDDYKVMAKTFIIEVTTNILSSSWIDEIKNYPQKLSINKISDIIIQSHELTHKKLKIKTNNDLLYENIKPLVLSSFKSFKFSETLKTVSNLKINDFFEYINLNKETSLISYKIDIQNKLIGENPLIFLMTNPAFFKNELNSIISKELEINLPEQTNIIISEIIEQVFKDNTLKPIIQKFDITKLRDNREEIGEQIKYVLLEKIISKSPLILILNPDLDLKQTVQEKVIDRFLNEFDLGMVLSNIARSLILKAHPEDEIQAELVFDFFINLSEIFPGGLPKQLWIIIVNLLQIYSNEAKVDLLHVNKIIKFEDIYWKTILENIKAYRVFNIINFNLAESGTELINLFDGVRETIGRSFNSFYTKFIWDFTNDSFGSFFNSLQLNIMANYQAIQTTNYLVKYLNFLKSKKFKYFDPIELGFDFKEFKKLVKPQITSSRAIAIDSMSEINPENVTLYFRKKLENTLKKSNKKSNEMQNELETIENYIPQIIEKEKIKSIKLKIDESGKIGSFDLEKVKNLIIKEEKRQFKSDSFLTDSNFLFIYCTTLLFDSLPSELTNKAIDIAIYNPKSSNLINKVVADGKNSKKGSTNDDYFIENLKREIIIIGNKILKQLISSTIHKEISKEKQTLKTFYAQKDEILAIKIGELHKSYKKWIEKDIHIHPKILIENESKKIVVYLEVGRRPTIGASEIENLIDVVALQTYNNEMVRFGVFIESLKIVASTLGERERNKVQKLFTSIGEFLITNES